MTRAMALAMTKAKNLAMAKTLAMVVALALAMVLAMAMAIAMAMASANGQGHRLAPVLPPPFCSFGVKAPTSASSGFSDFHAYI